MPGGATARGTQRNRLEGIHRSGSGLLIITVKPYHHVISKTRSKMDAVIALTSWGRIDKLSSFNDSEIMEFINDFRLAAPEPDAP